MSAVSDPKSFVVGSTPPGVFVNGRNWVTASRRSTRWTKIVATKTARPRSSLCTLSACARRSEAARIKDTCPIPFSDAHLRDCARRFLLAIHAAEKRAEGKWIGTRVALQWTKSLNWSDVRIISRDDFAGYNALRYAEESSRVCLVARAKTFTDHHLQMIHAASRIQCDTAVQFISMIHPLQYFKCTKRKPKVTWSK